MKKSLFVIVLCLVFLIPIYAQNKDSLYYFEDAISSHILCIRTIQQIFHTTIVFLKLVITTLIIIYMIPSILAI